MVYKGVGSLQNGLLSRKISKRGLGLAFVVMKKIFRENIGFIVSKEVFASKPSTIIRFRHTSNEGIKWEKYTCYTFTHRKEGVLEEVER